MTYNQSDFNKTAEEMKDRLSRLQELTAGDVTNWLNQTERVNEISAELVMLNGSLLKLNHLLFHLDVDRNG